MPKGTTEAPHRLQIADLKELALAKGPCLTIVAPLQHAPNMARQDYLHIKSAAQAAEPLLAERHLQPRQIREFLDPVTNIDLDALPEEARTVVVCRSPEGFRYFSLREHLKESVTIGDRFQVLSFYQALQNDHREFYVLALTQKHVRLLRCTNHDSEEVPLGPDIPISVEQWLNTRTPTTSPNHRSSQAPENGSTAGNFTSTTDRDKLDQHIVNFFHRIDEGVFEALRGKTAPLVLAGVDYEVSMYRNINRYPYLAEQSVTGSPESLKGGELHRRALDVVQDAFEEPMRRALQLYERLGGTSRTLQKPAEIDKAAGEARVSHLFIAEDAVSAGEASAGDSLNSAALQTLTHGGEVWVTNRANIPAGGNASAMLRY